MERKQQPAQALTVQEKNGKTFLSRSYDKLLVVSAFAMPCLAYADGIDVSKGSDQLALGLTAVGALGAAKLAPSALTWTWSLITGMARRG